MKDEAKIIIYNTQDVKASVPLYAKDGSAWTNQNQFPGKLLLKVQELHHRK